MYANAKFIRGAIPQGAGPGMISVERDGVLIWIPIDADNTDYLDLLKSGIPIDDPEPPPVPVPTITRRQCRLWLLQQHAKTSADVEAAIAAIADAATREAARIEWEDATAFHHDHPLMTALAPALGIDPATLPDAFRAAALL